MKTFKIFGIALFMVLVNLGLFACSSSSNDDNFDSESIVGKWECTSIDFSNYLDPDSYYENDDEEMLVGDKITFRSDGTYSDKSGSGYLKLNGNQLTISYNDGETFPAVFTVQKLTSNEFVLYINYGNFEGTYKFKR